MREEFQEFLERIKNPLVYRAIGLVALLAAGAFMFTSYVVTAILVVGVGVISWSMHKLQVKRIGVELTTLSTVLIAVTYGPLIGAIAGFGLIILQITAGQYTGGYIIWVIPSYPVAGIIAGISSSMEIFTLGAGLIIGMQMVFAILTSVSAAGRLDKYLPYAVTNIIFNLAVFYYVAPALQELMV